MYYEWVYYAALQIKLNTNFRYAISYQEEGTLEPLKIVFPLKKNITLPTVKLRRNMPWNSLVRRRRPQSRPRMSGSRNLCFPLTTELVEPCGWSPAGHGAWTQSGAGAEGHVSPACWALGPPQPPAHFLQVSHGLGLSPWVFLYLFCRYLWCTCPSGAHNVEGQVR